MNPQPLIGISGRKRTGKDTLAGFLVAGHGFTRLAFADPLKAIVAELNPAIPAYTALGSDDPDDAWRVQDELDSCKSDTDPAGWEGAKAEPEVRRLLQAQGEAVRRHLGENVWVDATINKAHYLLAEGKPVVIPDVRYPNEAERIKALGGIVVRVNRPGTAEGTSSTDLHISETALDGYDFDVIVTNDSDVAFLKRAAKRISDARNWRR